MVYNLGLGDIDPITGMVNDEVVSGNNDIDKILATIGYVVRHAVGHRSERGGFKM